MRISGDFEGARYELRTPGGRRTRARADGSSGGRGARGAAHGEVREGQTARLRVPPDPGDPRFRQWFAFDVRGRRGERVSFALENAAECTWARAWEDYYAFATHDGESWARVPTRYEDGVLRFEDVLRTGRARYAYYPLYENARVEALLRHERARGGVVRTLTRTPLGNAVRLLTLGRHDDEAPTVWVIGQQHPGEHQAGYWMEGFLERLGWGDDVAEALLDAVTLAIVPRVNPDGVALGNHRTNAAGLDLNRQWLEPDEDAPEIAAIRESMEDRGCALFLDVHGDETIPHVFVEGTYAVPRRTAHMRRVEAALSRALLSLTRDFQTEHGYPKEPRGKANLAIGSSWVGHRFRCPSLTLEMPFLDHDDAPDVLHGFGPQRARALGATCVEALALALEVGS